MRVRPARSGRARTCCAAISAFDLRWYDITQSVPVMRRIVVLILSAVAVSAAHAHEHVITLSSTTSTQDSGLFGYILPVFNAATGLSVHVVAVGTGQALAIGERGDADALLL